MDEPHIEQATLEDLPQLADLLIDLFTQEADFVPNRAKQLRGLRLILEQPNRGRICCRARISPRGEAEAHRNSTPRSLPPIHRSIMDYELFERLVIQPSNTFATRRRLPQPKHPRIHSFRHPIKMSGRDELLCSP